MTSPQRLILVAQIGASFGVKGEFKLLSFTANPLDVARYRPLYDEKGAPSLSLLSVRPHKGALIATAQDIGDKTKADGLKGHKLYIGRDQLLPTQDDDYYITDLIGLKVMGLDGALLGRITAVDNFGAGDLLDIAPLTGPSYYLAFTRENVPEVHIEKGFVVIAPPSDA